MFARMMLRNATVNALTEKGLDGQFPTIAGERVFDSRIIPIQETDVQNEIPICMVYTVGQEREKLNRTRTSHPLDLMHLVDLVIEIVVATTGVEEIKDGRKTVKKKVLRIVETDAELDALLDLLEAQVVRALASPWNKWCGIWHKLVTDVTSYSSEREADGDKNNRLAMRQITYQCRICPDPVPVPGIAKDGEPASQVTADLIPVTGTYIDDLLRTLQGQANTGSMMDVIQSTFGLDSGILLPALKRIGVNVTIPDLKDTGVKATMQIDLGADNGT